MSALSNFHVFASCSGAVAVYERVGPDRRLVRVPINGIAAEARAARAKRRQRPSKLSEAQRAENRRQALAMLDRELGPTDDFLSPGGNRG